ncbi:aminodeoxychorismate lyase [Isoalcanivorax beigongshangi]|uniref:Aminodeoxychorismate lyase n=1 Tax=Isoalcanivorax beigongshangi TaxID=3238810 RepID=A0ABV4AGS7_9GAMM
MDSADAVIWTPTPSDRDRALAYGDGLFETLRLQPSGAPLWRFHRARLLAGAQRLGLPLMAQRLDQALEQALARCDRPAVLKLILSAGEGGRGYARPASLQPQLWARLHPLQPPAVALREQGVKLGLCSLQLARQPALAGLKHLNRLEQVLARAEVSAAGWDEGVLCDSAGWVVECSAMNLFVRHGEQWWTPSLDQAGVAGVARSWLLEQLGEVAQDPRDLSVFATADEVLVCNSVAGIMPVRTLAGWSWPVGTTTRALQSELEQLFQ